MTSAINSTTGSSSLGGALSSATGAGGPMGKDQFVKLLVAQMTHQDPLNPMDGTQMASQLAQFSSVEQLMNIGNKLDAQTSTNASVLDSLDRNAALGMIGRTVTAVSDEITVSGHSASPVSVDVPNAGGKVVAHILDATGNEIGTANCGTMIGGRHALDLSGALKSVPNGSFTVKVEVLDSAGKSTALTPIQDFLVDGLKFGTNGAVLTAGSRSVSIGNVIGVSSK